MHVTELMRMGADTKIDASRASVTGKTQLFSATVIAPDLRASASLILAALGAGGLSPEPRLRKIEKNL